MPHTKDPNRDHRIIYEIVVDAYGDEEVNMSWYYYFADNLEFPFNAVAHLKKRNGKKENLDIEVIEVASNTDEPLKLGFVFTKQGFVFPIAVEDLFEVDTTEENLEILNDWLYWKRLPLL
ncbi:MAG: calcium-binding protein [Chitinophagales bacterium]